MRHKKQCLDVLFAQRTLIGINAPARVDREHANAILATACLLPLSTNPNDCHLLCREIK